MNNFSKYKNNDESWYSPHFYTTPNGYKAQLRIDANGFFCAKGTHVSAFLYLMKGHNDDQLKWPFEGYINVQLLNSVEDERHVERIFSHNRAPSYGLDRVSIGERANGGMSYRLFISHNDLSYNQEKGTQYLRDDMLEFKVTKVTLVTGNSNNISVHALFKVLYTKCDIYAIIYTLYIPDTT